MKRKSVLSGILALLFGTVTGCGNVSELPSQPENQNLSVASAVHSISQTGLTESVPDAYFQPSEQSGTVVEISYQSKDYSRDNAETTKPAYVYLPYGYDENDTETHYNICYLMHGWSGHAGEYFEYANIKEMLDNMISNGDIPPTIFVSPTFYSNDAQDFGQSVSQLRQFYQDFANDLMPTVEGQFHTYAESNSPDDLKASRNHRAFGGFSLGSVTTWLQLCYNYDYIGYFLPMSGSSWYYGGYGDFQIEKNVDFIEQLVKDNQLDERGYFIYHGVGTDDTVKSQSEMMAEEMLSRNDFFTPEHYVFYQKEGGQHNHIAVREFMYNALPLFFGDDTMNTEDFTENSTVSDVISNPVFGNFGKLLFPVDRTVSESATLKEISNHSVYVWYNNIKPEKTVEIVNHLKNASENGQQIFYSIYSEEEMTADSSKRDTGLFYFKGESGAKFAITNAGGGFMYVGAMHDSFPHALELSKMGYNAFALIYRLDDPYTDLAQAIAFIQNHAEELEVDPEQYSLWGGSAGARMVAELGNIDTLHSFDASLTQAGAVIMQYTGYTKTSRSDAPTYVCVGKNDGIASWKTMQNRLNTLESYGIPTEFHAYEGLPHGFGLGTDTIADGWIYDAVSFWENQMKDNNLPERRQVANLQNYLHGKTNHVHGNDYDFNNDNIWNIIDLALLKRKLLSNNPEVNN